MPQNPKYRDDGNTVPDIQYFRNELRSRPLDANNNVLLGSVFDKETLEAGEPLAGGYVITSTPVAGQSPLKPSIDAAGQDNSASSDASLPLASGGNGGNSGGMDRIDALEKRVDRLVEGLDRISTTLTTIDGKLDRGPSSEAVNKIAVDVAEMKGRLSGLASGEEVGKLSGSVTNLATAKEVGEIKGKVDRLPSTAKLLGLLALATAIVTFMPKAWQLVQHFWP